ncbi:MAG: flagellar basal body P-ring formation chaperone FlgA [Devosia sp.]
MNRFTFAALLALAATSAHGAPTLRGDITVTSAIVTVGDIFADSGPLAETALFRAPAPGTSGIVPLDAVQRAALGIGLTEFDNVGFTRIRVARASSVLDAASLGALVENDLRARGLLSPDMQAATRFTLADIAISAEAVATPARLVTLRYVPENGTFAARFQIAGIDQPVDLTGTVDLMVPALKLKASRPTGAILTEADFDTAMVPAAIANAGAFASIDQLIGKQLTRQSHAGMMLKVNDVSEPEMVRRNTLVTVFVRTGAMTLTVRCQALGDAAAGEAVDVLNTFTKKVLHGIARPDGSVEIPTALSVAGL